MGNPTVSIRIEALNSLNDYLLSKYGFTKGLISKHLSEAVNFSIEQNLDEFEKYLIQKNKARMDENKWVILNIVEKK